MNADIAVNNVNKKSKIDCGGIIGIILLAVGSIVMVFPFLWLISTALKNPTELKIWPPTLIPKQFNFNNFIGVFKAAPFERYFLNSFLLAAFSTLGILFSSSLAGYIFAKFHYKWLNFFFAIIVGTAIIPFEIYMIPLYLQMNSLGLVNKFLGMVMPNLVMSFGLFFMRQTIVQQIPDELMEAARVEGASEWRIFFSLILPLLRSTMAALGIFAFLEGWNSFVWPLLIVSSKGLYNMELGLAMFQSTYTIDVSLISAGSLISVIPIFIVFILLRKQIMQSIATTGLK
ncbi:MAG: carbohydrate ABC transporter permease [Clostridiaceae bacterium]